METLEKSIQKLYKQSVIRNIIGWNVAVSPTDDSYLAEQEVEETYLKTKNQFIKQFKEHAITKKFLKTHFPMKMEKEMLFLKQNVWKKYLELRKNKSNADEEYYQLFEKMVKHIKKMLNYKQCTAMELNDGTLGTPKEIMYVLENMANISKDVLNKSLQLNGKKKDFYHIPLVHVFAYLDTFKDIDYIYSNKNGSFMTFLDKDNARIHIKKDETKNGYEIASSITHEVGHALYQNKILNKNLITGQFGGNVSLSLHESSSILNEISCTGLKLEITDENALYRLGSHKLYYIIHLYIRLKIEDMILNQNLNPRNIGSEWNKLVKEYIGLEPKNDFEGFLQDVHWNSGSFGYFQSYGIGFFNAILMYENIKDELEKCEILIDKTNIVMDKISKTYGHFNENSSMILKEMYPNIDDALDRYKSFIVNNFYF